MQARWGMTGLALVTGLALGWLSRPEGTVAQIGTNRGFFGTLKVGDMVETAYDSGGKTVLRTYDDEANRLKMIARITDIGTDHIVLEIKSPDPASKEVWSVRYPIHSIGSIFHVSGASAPVPSSEPAAVEPANPKSKIPSKTKKTTK